jgi:c(7)-type cytochrome triheme protein
MRRGANLAVLLSLLVVSACSDEILQVFFDIPAPTPEELAAEAELERQQAEAAAARQSGAAQVAAPAPAGDPPAIETVRVWEQAAEMLPKDDLDEVDWMAALRQGVIKPRAAIGGRARAKDRVFGFDFYLPGPDPSMNAFFPHSAHTQWLTCASCHPAIFPVRGVKMTMDEIFAGEYCGRCHGVVAFALDNCFRCHTDME